MHRGGCQVVFGGSGLLGKALVRRLLETGSTRVIIVDAAPFFPELSGDARVRVITADVVRMDHSAVRDAIENAETVFFKIGKLGNPSCSWDIGQLWDYLNVNAVSFGAIMPVLKASGVRTVIVDSSITAVSDFSRSSPLAEFDVPGLPTNFYGLSKAILEDVCALWHDSQGIKVRVIRYPRIYCQTQKNFLSNFARSLLLGEAIHLYGYADKLVDLIHIDDAVETSLRCMHFQGDERVFHASYGEALTLRQIAELLCQRAGKPLHPVEVSTGGVYPREPLSASLADTYTSKKLGVEFRFSVEAIVEDAIRAAISQTERFGRE